LYAHDASSVALTMVELVFDNDEFERTYCEYNLLGYSILTE